MGDLYVQCDTVHNIETSGPANCLPYSSMVHMKLKRDHLVELRILLQGVLTRGLRCRLIISPNLSHIMEVYDLKMAVSSARSPV